MIRYPNFKPIILQCKKLMKIKHPLYDNTWIGYFAKSWWKKRLEGEIKEIFKAKNPDECKREICDAINILAMMYENADDFRYLKKKK